MRYRFLNAGLEATMQKYAIHRIGLVALACMLLSGCGYKVAKLKKYEHGADPIPKALLVVRINTLDYLDIKRLDDAEDKTSLSAITSTEQAPLAELNTTIEVAQTKPVQDLRKLFADQARAHNNTKTLSLDVTEYRILKPNFFFTPFSYARELYAIEPGTYYISLLGIDSEQGIYYSDAPGVNKDGIIAYGAFEIKPGEVLYLGDIECQWRSTNAVKKILVHDKLAAVKKDLQDAGLHQIAAQITTAKMYTHGQNILHLE